MPDVRGNRLPRVINRLWKVSSVLHTWGRSKESVSDSNVLVASVHQVWACNIALNVELSWIKASASVSLDVVLGKSHHHFIRPRTIEGDRPRILVAKFHVAIVQAQLSEIAAQRVTCES